MLWLLLVVVGLPFFVVATSAPLLQKWFANTGHPAAKDPYFLYGASNLGSMLALLLYPLVVEPDFGSSSRPALDRRLRPVRAAGRRLRVVGVAACPTSLCAGAASRRRPPSPSPWPSTAVRTGRTAAQARTARRAARPPDGRSDQARRSRPSTWQLALRAGSAWPPCRRA